MFFRRLSVRIGLNLIVLLALGMGLMNMVMTLAVQRTLVHQETERARRLAAALARNRPNEDLSREFRLMAKLSPGIEIRQFHPDTVAPQEPEGNGLSALVRAAARNRQPLDRTVGQTWGVFWKRPARVQAAVPQPGGGSVGVSLDLRPLYGNLRRTEGMILGYFLVNLLLLSFAGVARLHRLAVYPLHRLLQRAEAFRGDEEVFFLGEEDGGEFTQLSRSLNRMLFRISEGKQSLRSMVRSLETANRELRQARKDVINAEKLASVGRLSAGIAHEIGNPIAIVIGYLELLKQPDLPEPDRAEFVRRTEAEIHRINAIIRQLLDLSRPSAGQTEPVSLHNLIREIGEVVGCQPLMNEIQLDLHLDASADRVLADPGQLRQVFLNLLLNAADAIASQEKGASEGRIEISTRLREASRTEIEIAVVDNGPGIPEDQLDNIFDPFFTTKEPGKGTGLGLSVSFMIVQAAGGSITATSPSGDGTRIVIRLPVYSEES